MDGEEENGIQVQYFSIRFDYYSFIFNLHFFFFCNSTTNVYILHKIGSTKTVALIRENHPLQTRVALQNLFQELNIKWWTVCTSEVVTMEIN